MNKLFLTSADIKDYHIDKLLQLAGKRNTQDLKFILIENAADPYLEERKNFVYDTREMLSSFGIEYSLLDLREYIGRGDELGELLINQDVVWCGGGNTYYLMDALKKTGFDLLEKDLFNNNVIYAGGSAGSIVCSPSILGYETVDDPSILAEPISNGLGWFPKQIIPHWDNPKYKLKLGGIADDFTGKIIEFETINDNQVIISEGGKYEII